jgi:alginate O-acetyltransferase complex protein AlgI
VRDGRGKRAQGRFGRPGRVASWALTFLFLLVTWVIFRAPDFAAAREMLGRMASLGAGGIHGFYVQGLAALGAGVLLHLWSARHADRSPSLDLRRPLAWPALAALLLAVLLFSPFGTSPFIYLQF